MRWKFSRSFKFISNILALGVIVSTLTGCIVPEAMPLLGHERKKRILYEVIRGVNCELSQAVQRQIFADRNKEFGSGRKLEWFEKWGGLINLTLKIHDEIEFNPGVTLNTPNLLAARVGLANGTIRSVPQDYSFGIGGAIKYNAGREDTVAYNTTIVDALNANIDVNKSCYSILGFAIESDLDLDHWLDDALEPVKNCAIFGNLPGKEEKEAMPFSSAKIVPPDKCSEFKYKRDPIETIVHKVEFIITFDVNATPTWKLVRVDSGTSGKLFDYNRKDTSTLILTFGPKEGAGGPIASGGGARRRKMEGLLPPTAQLSPVSMINYQAAVFSSAIRNSVQQ